MTIPYIFQTTLDLPYEAAIERTMATLKQEGFGILTQIDVKDTLKQKLDADFRRYIIFGACNPPLAYQALLRELDTGLLLPCNVIIYETDEDRSMVAIADPLALLEETHAPMQNVASEVLEKLIDTINTIRRYYDNTLRASNDA